MAARQPSSLFGVNRHARQLGEGGSQRVQVAGNFVSAGGLSQIVERDRIVERELAAAGAGQAGEHGATAQNLSQVVGQAADVGAGAAGDVDA